MNNTWGWEDPLPRPGHKANLAKSERLQKTLRFLKSWRTYGATSAMIQGHTGSVAVATDISEIRRNGHDIECKYIGVNSRGRKLYNYTHKGKRGTNG